jgi:hypothetical protein
MKLVFATITTLTLLTLPAQAEHPCADDAKLKAEALLRLHMDGTWKIDASNIDPKVTELPPVKALAGTGKLDVLDLTGYVYKGTYRLRMLYAQREGCSLIGQEVMEYVAVK